MNQQNQTIGEKLLKKLKIKYALFSFILLIFLAASYLLTRNSFRNTSNITYQIKEISSSQVAYYQFLNLSSSILSEDLNQSSSIALAKVNQAFEKLLNLDNQKLMTKKEKERLELIHRCLNMHSTLSCKDRSLKDIAYLLSQTEFADSFFNKQESLYSAINKKTILNIKEQQIQLTVAIIIFLLLTFLIIFPLIRYTKETIDNTLLQEKKNLEVFRLAELGTLSSSVGHEIKNQLAVINSHILILKKLATNNKLDNELLLSRLDSINKNSKSIQDLVFSIGNLSRKGDNDKSEYVSIKSLINDALIVAKDKAKSKGITFFEEVEDNLRVYCKRTEMSQVILNLVINSIHAIDKLEEKWVKIQAISEEQNVIIRIVDSGKGIPEDVASHIFDPFYTTKEADQGTGLGLWVGHRITEANGGELSYKFLDGNTSFQLKFDNEKIESLKMEAANQEALQKEKTIS